jgi:MFS transporter, DHA1 family, multidrug resistance protein
MFSLFIIMVGIGIVIPVLPYYVEEFGASEITLGMLFAIFALMQFLLAPFWGNISDRIGRKPMIILGLIGFAIGEFIFAFATDIWMLFISRMIAGAFGSALMPTAMAYVSDVTSNEKRAQGMGMLGAAMAFGIVIGPGIGGWLAQDNLATPFLFAGIAASFAALLAMIFLKESLKKEDREEVVQKQSQFEKMKIALKSEVGYLLFLIFILSFALANFQAVFGYYALVKFDYEVDEVATIVVITGVVGTLVQGGLVGRLSKKFGDERLVKGALLLSAFGFIVMTLAFNYITVILTTVIFFIGNSLLRPSVNSLISKLAGKQQGAIMGLNNSFMSLGNVVGPLIATALFKANIYFPYLSGAFILLIAFLATKVWLERKKAAMRQSAVAE